MSDTDLPIAIRRPRRSNSSHRVEAMLPTPEPRTPRRGSKTVRFSSPGPGSVKDERQLSSSLTPMIRRASITTPRHRRASTPGTTPRSRCYRSYDPIPAPPLFLKPSTAQGRVERRIRRGNMRDLLNKMEEQKKRSVRQAQAEAQRLRSEIEARDREIHQLRNAPALVDTDRIWELEQQIDNLGEELEMQSNMSASSEFDWMAPFSQYPTMDGMLDDDDEDFGDTTVAQFLTSTPSRGRTLFPTPPSTSPAAPTTRHKEALSREVGLQANLPDPAKEQMTEELASLQLEVKKLTATLDSYRALGQRTCRHLSTVIPASQSSDDGESDYDGSDYDGSDHERSDQDRSNHDGSDHERSDQDRSNHDGSDDQESNGHDSCLVGLERQVKCLVQAMDERVAALALLTSTLSNIGFPGNNAAEMAMSMASSFRAARLELEYLTPGELALPLTSQGAEVLDLLLTRLRTMSKQCQEDESTIDEYHEIEQSLRKQLDARVSVMDGLKDHMTKMEQLLQVRKTRIKELEVSNDRLKGAVDCYMRDISELEELVERLERQAREARATHHALQKGDLDTIAERDASITELEAKLSQALEQTERLRSEFSDVQESSQRQMWDANQRHSQALALRDSRVLELRGEVDRLEESLRAAHDAIQQLQTDKEGLSTRLHEEKHKATAAVDAIKTELHRVMQMGQAFLDATKSPPPVQAEDADGSRLVCVSGPVKRSNGWLDAEMAKRDSTKRRRGDSGMALLEEDAAGGNETC